MESFVIYRKTVPKDLRISDKVVQRIGMTEEERRELEQSYQELFEGQQDDECDG